MIRHSLVDMNSVHLKYYPFMISENKCTGSCNIFSPKICVPKEIKDINVNAFNMITNKDEATTEHIYATVNANLIQIKNGIIKHVNVNVKIIISAKNIIVGILVHVFVRIVSI